MKKLSTLYFFLFPLCLVLLLVRCFKDKADISNQITILVKDNDTNLPISYADVRFCPTTYPASIDCQDLGKTDDDGQLIFNLKTFLVPGNSKFYISKDGFKNDSILVSDFAQKTFSLNLEKLANYNTEFTILVKEKKTNLPIQNATVVFCEYTYPVDMNCQEIGKTDANGQLNFNLNSFLFPGSSKFYVFKDGFYRDYIPVVDKNQKLFSSTLGKIASLEFHLKYDSDSIPKEFYCYLDYTAAPAHNFPGGNFKDFINAIYYTPKVNGVYHVDTTIYVQLKDSDYWQYFHSKMCDTSYVFTSSLYFPNSIPDKVLNIPPHTNDTTIVFNAFW
jgi:hypothetical protein